MAQHGSGMSRVPPPRQRWRQSFFLAFFLGAFFSAILMTAISAISRYMLLAPSPKLGLRLQSPSAAPHDPAVLPGKAAASYPAALSASAPLPAKGSRCVVLGAQSMWRGYVSKEFHTFFEELRTAAGWDIFDSQHHPWDYNVSRAWRSWGDVADALQAAPEVLLIMEVWELGQWGPRDPRLANTAVWFWMDDLHWFSPKQREQKAAVLRPGVVDAVVGTYMPLLEHFFPGAAGLPRLHLPHAASAHFLLPLNPAPLPRVLLAGAASPEHYPYRALVAAKVAAGDARFVQLHHPGYTPSEMATNSAVTGSNFAAVLHRHLAVITDGLVYNYTVAKLFEIPAVGALLLANSELTPHLAALGFMPGVHFVEYTWETLDAVVDWVLGAANRGAVEAVRAQGQALVWARHTVQHRVAALNAAARMAAAVLHAALPPLPHPLAPLTVDSIVFSKDRPLRLLALLESRARHCRNAGSAAVVVRASSTLLRSAYQRVEELNPAIRFFYEGEAPATGTFREATLAALTGLHSPYIMPLVDDVVFTRSVDLAHVAAALRAHAPEGTFQLRLTLAYEGAGELQRPLHPTQPLMHDAVHCYTWSAALEATRPAFFHFVNLDAGVYAKERVAREWGALQFTHPGELEMGWYASKFTYAPGVCAHFFYAHGACVNVETGGHVRPDAVQGTELHALEEDATALLRGERLSMAELVGWNVSNSHLVLPLPRMPGEEAARGASAGSDAVAPAAPDAAAAAPAFGACPWQLLRAPGQPICTPSALHPAPFVFARHHTPPYWLLTFGVQDYVSRVAIADQPHATGKETWFEWSTDDLMRRYLAWVQRERGRGAGMAGAWAGTSESCVADPVWLLDVGANIGTHAVSAAAEGFPVLALEATHMCATRLACSKEANRFEHLVVRRVGVGAVPGETCLNEHSGSPTNVGGYKVRTSAADPEPNARTGLNASTLSCEPGERTSLRIAPLGDIVQELEASLGRPLPAPAILKLDCEGCEWNAVQGAYLRPSLNTFALGAGHALLPLPPPPPLLLLYSSLPHANIQTHRS